MPISKKIIDDARNIYAALANIEFVVFNGFNRDKLGQEISKVDALMTEISTLESQLSALRNNRDQLYQDINETVKRIRTTVKAQYGDNSNEYEMVGGTRSSDRKKPTRNSTVIE